MTVANIIDQIIARIPNSVFVSYGEPGILIILNRMYHNLNRELNCLEKSIAITEDGTGAGVALPTDWIRPFAVDTDDIVYIPNTSFEDDEDDTYTFKGNRIYFGSADGSTVHTFDYYSSGLTLVRTVANANIEVASPEWPEESLGSVLYYGTLLELNVAGQFEASEYFRIKKELGSLEYNRDGISPTRTMPHLQSAKNRYIDDYEKP